VIKLSIMGLALGLAACAARSPDVPADDKPRETTAPVQPVISLERTPCFGTCPVYTVSVSPSGQVTFEGRAHVRFLGRATGQIPRQRVDALLVELERAGYFRFAGRYAASEPVCGRYVTDLPSAISTAVLHGRTKRIEHDHGCGAAPGALAVLEKRIDEVLGSDRWIGSEK
jgi:hypothetical protein